MLYTIKQIINFECARFSQKVGHVYTAVKVIIDYMFDKKNT